MIKISITQEEPLTLIKTNKHSIDVVIDRFVLDKKQLNDEQEQRSLRSRLNQSIEDALHLSNGLVIVAWVDDPGFDFPEKPKKFSEQLFSENLACTDCGISLDELEPRLFRLMLLKGLAQPVMALVQF